MKANQAEFPVAALCRVLEVSTSGYYAWLKRGASQRVQEDERLTQRLRLAHNRSKATYGAPRLHATLQQEGIRVGRKRVARLMREAGLRGASRRRFVTTTTPDKAAASLPDLVDRSFKADGPDKLWVADITYVPTLTGFLFLAVVLDVFSRKVVGWSMETDMRTQLVLSALDMAIQQRRPKAVIHHSDRGSQYTSIAFGQRCEEVGVRPSNGSVGDCYDNAMAESFFATLECELLAQRRFKTPAEAKTALFEFIEGWYNTRRLHSGLGYLSPVAYERQAMVATS